MGTVMTYYPQTTNADGSVKVVLRSKIESTTCTDFTWICLSGDCGTNSVVGTSVYLDNTEPWCQTEEIMTRLVPSNAPFQLLLDGENWIDDIMNDITHWRALTLVELRNRSDIGKANTSPQTTTLPVVRVPSNCQRDFNLLAFDPDGDEVKCRYGNTLLSECNPCTPPSVLSLSSACTLSFSPTSSMNEGPYAVQLVMEDFPWQTITLTQTDGGQTTITTDNAISKIPVQFVLQVDPVVPSCTDGLYLPKFLPPTPDNRAQLYTSVNHTVEINIKAEANISMITELLYSGLFDIKQTTLAAGEYILSWTASQSDDGETQPICFVVQAVSSSVKYHSELRCVIVIVVNVVALSAKISSLSPLSEEYIKNTVIQQLKDELVRRGLPPIKHHSADKES
ncbi:uncharacterized protein LOC113157143 [Anabas testudineus]|uniref:uncharacterized protein LOC113157143 n=1 Tax=Anabas testudineus TaxID=64144 RepID=UPI000E4586DF|nr:uncharacterized protein LOC113157143 [Anabas testudineus]